MYVPYNCGDMAHARRDQTYTKWSSFNIYNYKVNVSHNDWATQSVKFQTCTIVQQRYCFVTEVQKRYEISIYTLSLWELRIVIEICTMVKYGRGQFWPRSILNRVRFDPGQVWQWSSLTMEKLTLFEIPCAFHLHCIANAYCRHCILTYSMHLISLHCMFQPPLSIKVRRFWSMYMFIAHTLYI